MILRSPCLNTPRPSSPLRAIRLHHAAVLLGVAMFLTQPTTTRANPLFGAPFVSYNNGEYNTNGPTAIGDFNGDGNPDLVSTNYLYGVSVLLGRGDGTFGPRSEVGVRYPYDTYTVAVGDLNGDGREDLVTATGTIVNTDTINVASVFLGNGDGTFGPPRDFVTGMQPRFVAIGDVNRDGKPDLVTANSQGSVSVLLGNGDGTFRTRTDYPVELDPQFLAMADLDGDGDLDLAVLYDLDSNKLSVLLGNGDGSFGATNDYATGNTPVFVAAGDVNGDGKPDLVTANYGDNINGSISILLGYGDGTFGARTDIATGIYSFPRSVAIADLNGDNQEDLAVVTEGDFSVTVFLGQGNGTFLQATKHTVGIYAGNAVLGDLNRDGKLDVALTTYSEMTVLLGNGDATFGTKDEVATGQAPSSVAIGDLNGDGMPDMAVTNRTSSTVSVLLGNGTGRFTAGNDFATGSNPSSVAIGDLNRDGRADLVVANSDNANSISVLLGNGDGTFAAKNDYGVGQRPTLVAIGDLNGDGNPDLVTANSYENFVSVLLGNGDGTFSNRKDFPSGEAPVSVAIGDLNGDGKPDLAVADAGSWALSVLLGKGDGTFEGAVLYDTGPWATSVAIGDLNSDGKPDLAVATTFELRQEWGPGKLYVYVNQGDGTFGAPTTIDASVKPTSIAIADLDMDGNADLAVTNHETYTVSVWLGDGKGALGNRTDYGTGLGSACVAIGDLNKDGKPDLAIANSSDNTVSLLLNRFDLSTPVQAALVSVDAKPGRVLLRWSLGTRSVVPARVYRRIGAEAWEVRGEVTSDGQGTVSYEDADVKPATKYGYCLGMQSGDHELLSGEVSVTVPGSYTLALEGVQPNPASKDWFVSLSLPDDSPARLDVFDMAGRRVLTRQLNGLGPGPHRVPFSGSRLASGVYVVRLDHGSQRLTTRAVVIQ